MKILVYATLAHLGNLHNMQMKAAITDISFFDRNSYIRKVTSKLRTFSVPVTHGYGFWLLSSLLALRYVTYFRFGRWRHVFILWTQCSVTAASCTRYPPRCVVSVSSCPVRQG